MSRRLLHIVLVLLLFTSCGHRSQEMSEALLRAEEMNRNYQSMDTLKGMEQVARCRLRLPYPLPNLWADVCALSAATLPSTRTGG